VIAINLALKDHQFLLDEATARLERERGAEGVDVIDRTRSLENKNGFKSLGEQLVAVSRAARGARPDPRLQFGTFEPGQGFQAAGGSDGAFPVSFSNPECLSTVLSRYLKASNVACGKWPSSKSVRTSGGKSGWIFRSSNGCCPAVVTAACVAGSRCGIWASARAMASNLCRLLGIQQILSDAAENPVVCLLVCCWRQVYFDAHG